jgi:pyrroloquinoline quinone biosynthesis protein D
VLLSLEDGTYYSLNDVGAHVWSLCDGSRTVAQLVEGVCAEFDAPPDVVTSDVVALVDELASERLLVEG